MKAYSLQGMQLPDIGLCMHVDIYMKLMHAKDQMAT